MRYFCTLLIIFLSACSPAPVQRAPANSLSEADDLAYRDDLTPKEKRQLLLSTPYIICLLYTSPSPRDRTRSRMPSSA